MFDNMLKNNELRLISNMKKIFHYRYYISFGYPT